MLVMIAALLLAGIVAYSNTFSDPFFFDDGPSIVDNPTIRSLWPPWSALTPPATGASVANRPVINYSFAVNYAFGGLDVRGYHLANLAIHLCAALALFGIVRRTLRQPVLHPRFGDSALSIAFVVALWWLLHPLQTESVTCVVQRTESLMGLCYLLTLYTAIRAMQSPQPLRWQILAFAACLAGMASKEVMVSAPFIVFLYDRTFVSGTFRAAWDRRKWSYVSLAATWILLAWLVLVWGGGNRSGTSSFGRGITTGEYFLTQCEGIVRYLKLSFWPHPLVLDYGTYLARDPMVIVPCFLFLSTLAVASVMGLWRRPAWGFVGIWFFAILAPSSSLVPLPTQTLAEHRMYLPLAAVIALSVVGLHALTGRRFLLVGIGLAVGLGALTIRRNTDYRSAVAIWSDTVIKCPDNARAQYGLGFVLLRAGRAAEAIPHDQRALQINPNLPDVWCDLGLAYGQVGQVPAAIGYYEQALRLKPDHAGAHNNLGAVLYTAGRFQEAIRHFQLALQSRPDYPDAEYNIGLAFTDTGRIEEAIAAFHAAVRSDPGFVAAWIGLGKELERSGRTTEAIINFEEALHRDPASAEARAGLARLRPSSP
jgi:Tfp pilus assembly protein PilF